MHEIAFTTAKMPQPPVEPEWIDVSPALGAALVRAFDFIDQTPRHTRTFAVVHLTPRYVVGLNPSSTYFFEHSIDGIVPTHFVAQDRTWLNVICKQGLTGFAGSFPARSFLVRDGSWNTDALVGERNPEYWQNAEKRVEITESTMDEPSHPINWHLPHLNKVIRRFSNTESRIEFSPEGITIHHHRGVSYQSGDFGTFDGTVALARDNFLRLAKHATARHCCRKAA
ncbi:hypothetical protein AL035_13765 [Salipiger aestuarii]|uniref:Uncharacterized protein n=1 Tax=Salipiger aestuarii TaxID=568098 RepID=A0A327XXG9_9RHOB|nr:hypothetical protein [Salipiger aestuarii]KAB2541124.1 hypothetical protein AL035_13765 [Salipiger aestuarii]RAK13353.1 hypothetical protein ATI53_10352 [Salipiger aestuarii]